MICDERHDFSPVLLRLIWSWYLRERWNEFNRGWIWLSIMASLLPDIDHLFYFLGYGRKDSYTSQIKSLLKTRQWRTLPVFIESGHKQNTNLTSHNYYVMIVFLATSILSSFYSWRVGVILFGAMFIHYVFDIVDDIIQLGTV